MLQLKQWMDNISATDQSLVLTPSRRRLKEKDMELGWVSFMYCVLTACTLYFNLLLLCHKSYKISCTCMVYMYMLIVTLVVCLFSQSDSWPRKILSLLLIVLTSCLLMLHPHLQWELKYPRQLRPSLSPLY